MNGAEKSSFDAGSDQKDKSRGRSTIEFPYGDLDDAEEVAKAVHAVGGTNCTWDQLAAKMGQAPTGGGFRLRVAAARTFGLLTYERGEVELTDLGIKLIDPRAARAARAEAFLFVPLFRAAFEKFKSAPLPPAAAIERQFELLGVAPKQKDKARHVFMRSAKSAGYFELASDRLVAPPLTSPAVEPAGNAATASPRDDIPPRNMGGNGHDGGSLPPPRHPFIEGLLKTMPPPETEWAISDRAKWLQTAANIFDLIYSTADAEGGSITVEVKK